MVCEAVFVTLIPECIFTSDECRIGPSNRISAPGSPLRHVSRRWGAERFNKGKPVPEGGLFEIVRLGGTFDSPLSLPEKDGTKMNNPPGKYPDVTEQIQ